MAPFQEAPVLYQPDTMSYQHFAPCRCLELLFLKKHRQKRSHHRLRNHRQKRSRYRLRNHRQKRNRYRLQYQLAQPGFQYPEKMFQKKNTVLTATVAI